MVFAEEKSGVSMGIIVRIKQEDFATKKFVKGLAFLTAEGYYYKKT